MSNFWRGAAGSRLGILALSGTACALIVSGRGFASSDNAGRPGQPAPHAICQDCGDPGDPPPTPRPTPTPTPPPPRPSFTTLMSRYTAYNMNSDAIAEINWLRPLFPNPEPYYYTPNGVVLVLVNPNLVTDDPAIRMSRLEMNLWLAHLGADIANEGFFPYFIEASVYAGTDHQDGRTLLALRRFVKEVRTHYPVTGVLLVGSFPDAAIVRSVFVKTTGTTENPADFPDGSEPVSGHTGHFLALDAELVTPRGEIVLADLDGNWEALYQQGMFTHNGYSALPLEPSAAYPENGQIIETPHYKFIPRSFQDAFYIQDHQVGTWTDSGWLRLTINSLDEPSPEANGVDRGRPNRIARPEIHVSRLDPLRVAVMPQAPRDLDGKLPLDAAGLPQKLRYSVRTEITWVRDRSLERELIADYIRRSHAFRLGHDNDNPFRTSAIRGPDTRLMSPGSMNSLLRLAASFTSGSTAVDTADLREYIDWLKQPAVLRGIIAHSNPVNSQFDAVLHPLELELATGGLDFATGSHVWRWVPREEGATWWLEPSFAGLTTTANFHIHRTMWETQALFDSGERFYVHEGCEVMRPANAANRPYSHPDYGQANDRGAVANGESLMFYANGLGLMARNKVFNDSPTGYFDAVKASGGRFGFGWRAYFLDDAENASLNERTADPKAVNPGFDRRTRTLQRKRTYFWNTIGDFTLKIRY